MMMMITSEVLGNYCDSRRLSVMYVCVYRISQEQVIEGLERNYVSNVKPHDVSEDVQRCRDEKLGRSILK